MSRGHDNIIQIYKNEGETPLGAIERFVKENPQYSNRTMGYAGRLDPMARGVLLVLVDDENKKRKVYELLEKKYRFSILFGISTDTYDILGKITETRLPTNVTAENIQRILPPYVGSLEQIIPPYSSHVVKGKPLFWWARHDKLDEIKIPSKKITITSFNMTGMETITSERLATEVPARIQNVVGDFRQEEILKKWIEFFSTNQVHEFQLAHFTLTCSSGTYVRGISHVLGIQMGFGGLAYSIERTAVGEFALEEKAAQ